MFILDSNRYARDAASTVAQIPATVEQFGGEVLASRLWEERRLAYPIKGHRKGTYWLTYFQLPGDQVTSLNRQFQLNESIVRSLTLKIEPRIADAMGGGHSTSIGYRHPELFSYVGGFSGGSVPASVIADPAKANKDYKMIL